MGVLDGPWGRARAAAPAPAAEPEAASHYPCRSCGAILGYQPGQHVLTCGFCGTVTEIPHAAPAAAEAAVQEQDFAAALAQGAGAAAQEETQVAGCEACGAQVEFDPGQHAAVCPFCATPIVADPSPDRHIRPQALLPFALSEVEARDRLRRWLGGLWFAPNGLKDYARTGGRLSGVYTPWWTFDARTETVYAGRRGDAFTQTVRGAKGAMRQVTQIRWRPARGRVARAFDDVLARASTSLSRQEAEGLGPFDLSVLQPYARDYLAGFRAEAYTVALREGYADARAQMDDAIRADVRRAIGGDRQQIERIDVKVDGVTFKHVLLPVWIGAYRYRGRSYRVLVNGRSGMVTGSRPYSVWKIALAAALGAAVAAAALAVAAWERGAL